MKGILRNKQAKSKKNIVGIAITIGSIGLFASFFIGAIAAIGGVILAIAIIAAIGVGTYFLLKKVDDLPDVLN